MKYNDLIHPGSLKARLIKVGFDVKRVEEGGRLLGMQVFKDGIKAHSTRFAGYDKGLEICEAAEKQFSNKH